jgi:hypothetical protein
MTRTMGFCRLSGLTCNTPKSSTLGQIGGAGEGRKGRTTVPLLRSRDLVGRHPGGEGHGDYGGYSKRVKRGAISD